MNEKQTIWILLRWCTLFPRLFSMLILIILMWVAFHPRHAEAQSCGCSWRQSGCQRANVLGCNTSPYRPAYRPRVPGNAESYPAPEYDYEKAKKRAEYQAKIAAAEQAAKNQQWDEALKLAREALYLQDDDDDDQGLQRWIAKLEIIQKYSKKWHAAEDAFASGDLDLAIDLASQALALNENAYVRNWMEYVKQQKIIDGMFEKMRIAMSNGNVAEAIGITRDILRISDDPDLRDWIGRMDGYAIIEQQLKKGNFKLAEHMRRFPAPPSPCPMTCMRIGLVVGLGQEYNTYHYHAATADQAEAKKEFENRLRQAGVRPEAIVQYLDYDYVIGMGRSTSLLGDLGVRVLWDNLSNGRATPLLQKEYEDLRGLSFGTLDCYSNGAMICLGALSNGDVKATNVRLIGPQLSPLAIQQWNELLQRGEIQKLQIYINKGDPVPAISLVANYLFPVAEAASLSLQAVNQILSSLGLRSYVSQTVPAAEFIYLNCASPEGYFLPSCHYIDSYSID